jgi:hypothetical protein
MSTLITALRLASPAPYMGVTIALTHIPLPTPLGLTPSSSSMLHAVPTSHIKLVAALRGCTGTVSSKRILKALLVIQMDQTRVKVLGCHSERIERRYLVILGIHKEINCIRRPE